MLLRDSCTERRYHEVGSVQISATRPHEVDDSSRKDRPGGHRESHQYAASGANAGEHESAEVFIFGE